jgi:hypothetical protein
MKDLAAGAGAVEHLLQWRPHPLQGVRPQHKPRRRQIHRLPRPLERSGPPGVVAGLSRSNTNERKWQRL